jgi:hypothetical protein
MSRVCTVCGHEQRYDIDTILVCRSKPYRDIAGQFGLSKTAIGRHVSEGHISELLALATDAEQASRADTLLDRVEELQRRTLAILEATEKTHEHRTALAAIAEARRGLELIGEITKEISRTPTLTLHLNAEWIEIRTAILSALAPHPHVRESVLRALEEVSNGRAA